MLTIEGAEALTESVIKLWEVNGGNPRSRFFHMSNQDFVAWRDGFNIAAPNLVRDVTQSPEGLLVLTNAWENQIPQSGRCTIRRHQAAVDDTNARNYAANVRRTWYTHIFRTQAPASYSDTDWIELIDITVESWKEAAQYMVEKKTAGRAMIASEDKYLHDSLEAVSLPALMLTGVMTYDDAIGEARSLTNQGNAWVTAANSYYHMQPTPTTRAVSGLTELIGGVIQLNDWNYQETKRAIAENNPVQYQNVRTGSDINLRTFQHIRDAERENLIVFRELYKERPAPLIQHVPQIPEPRPRSREERQEEDQQAQRDTEQDRDALLFHEKFGQIIRACEGNINDMGAGEVQTWLDTIKSCQDTYQRVFRIYRGDPDYIRRHHTETQSSDGGPPIIHNYICQDEMHNWIRALQDRKIELNDERTQTNDKKRQEIKGREEMLKSENLLVKLTGERNFVVWLDSINKVFDDAPPGTSDYKLAMVMRNSILNPEDKRNTNGMTVVTDITQYMEQRYMRSPSLLNSSLLDIRERKAPRSYQEAADNISATISIGRILASLEIQDSLEISHLAMLESRCIMLGTRRELYNQKQSENLQTNSPGAAQTHSTPNNSFQGRPTPIPSRGGATRVVNQLSESMRIAQAGNDAKIRRTFFFAY